MADQQFGALYQVGAMRTTLPWAVLVCVLTVRASVIWRDPGTLRNALGAKSDNADQVLRFEALKYAGGLLDGHLTVASPLASYRMSPSRQDPSSSLTQLSATEDIIATGNIPKTAVSSSDSGYGSGRGEVSSIANKPSRPSRGVLRRQIQRLLSQLLKTHLSRLAELRRKYTTQFGGDRSDSPRRRRRTGQGPDSGGAVMYLPVGGGGGGKRCPTAADAAASSISQMAFLSLILAIFNVVANISNNINNNNNNNNNNNDNNVSSSNTNLSSNNNNANQINVQLPPPVPGRRRRSPQELREDAKRLAARAVITLLQGVARSRRASFLCAVSDVLCTMGATDVTLMVRCVDHRRVR